jgi:hypothetical protein
VFNLIRLLEKREVGPGAGYEEPAYDQEDFVGSQFFHVNVWSSQEKWGGASAID